MPSPPQGSLSRAEAVRVWPLNPPLAGYAPSPGLSKLFRVRFLASEVSANPRTEHVSPSFSGLKLGVLGPS